MKSFLIKSTLIMLLGAPLTIFPAHSGGSFWSSFLRGAASAFKSTGTIYKDYYSKNKWVTAGILGGLAAAYGLGSHLIYKNERLHELNGHLYDRLHTSQPFANVEALLKQIPPRRTDRLASMSIDLAISHYSEIESYQLVDMMLKRKFSPNDRPDGPLWKALYRQYLGVAKLLINAGVAMDINLLCSMITHKKYKSVEFLLDNDLDISKNDERGNTPLAMAVFHNDERMVQLLFKYGAISTINTFNEWCGLFCPHDASPLMIAVHLNNPGMIKLLLSRGANINLQNPNGVTALMDAAESGNIEAVKLLLNHNADVTIKDNDGRTAIDYAQKAIDIHLAMGEEVKRVLESRVLHRAAQRGISDAERTALFQNLSQAEQREINDLRFFEPGYATGALNNFVVDYLSGDDVDTQAKLEIEKSTELQQAEEQSKEDAEQHLRNSHWQDLG